MKPLFALLMLTAAAQAQTSPQGTCRSADGSTAWTSNLDECARQGGYFTAIGSSSVLTVCMTPECGRLSGTRLIPRDGEPLISAAPRPQCEDGWSLVDAGRPMCARELREPKAY